MTLTDRIAAWSARHRRTAILGWLGLVLLAFLASVLVTGPDARNEDPGDTGRAQSILDNQREYLPVEEKVLVQARAPGRHFGNSPELLAAAEDLIAELKRRPDAVTGIGSPLEPGSRPELGSPHVSADGRSGLVTFRLAWPVEKLNEHFSFATNAVATVAARHPEVRLAQAGDRSLSGAVDEAIKADLARSHLLSLPLVLIILLIVFGAVVAAGIPVLLTATTLIATFTLLSVIGKVVAINSAGSALILLIGVAVGIDYSLFYLRRYREERQSGVDDETALRTTARTSGHVVLFSGLTVMLSLVGLVLTGLGVFTGGAIGMTVVVGLAMIASVTVLPAILAVLRHRVDKGRIPWLGKGRTAARESRIWSGVARRVARRPLVWGGAAVLALLALAVPALDMKLQDAAAVNSLPRSVAQVDAAIRMQEAFPGAPTPARVVIWQRDQSRVDGMLSSAVVDRLRTQVRESGGLLAEPVTSDRVGTALVVRMPLAGSGTDDTSVRALEHLRHKAIPAAFGGFAQLDAAVSGKTAQTYDFTNQLRDRTPLVFAFVLLLSFVVLIFVFRSITVPLVSIALNLLSIGAAYGVITWIFQYGNLSGLLGFTPYGGVMGWLPLFMFVVLFGLSMDYHIFILSRIRERWTDGLPAREAVVSGLGASAGVVTSAAVIMTLVFAVFVTLTSIENKMLGVGLAVAVLLDATLVRGVLVPAALSLLGERAWRLPGFRASRAGTDRRVRGPRVTA
ncbi:MULTISPECIES: MMPL family transporter [unclassified Crossiella]|uniref:MMPL family transporter n=1 Tax=unclassified Crossiella TaxID=2620835 RepID=UPI001FFE999E|nr:MULTISPECIES: MMPL family transporter [unclassified Crossiella]MCK2239805.1 MMPL family transporter [Crossiella sp. S99.2]MCK2252500.1 MMPL family transporter [Crossiella sp. S99.1]